MILRGIGVIRAGIRICLCNLAYNLDRFGTILLFFKVPYSLVILLIRKGESLMSDKAIVMISIGLRPWRKYTSCTFKRYCDQHGFDFYLVIDEREVIGPRLAGIEEIKGRRNKHLYAGKTFLAWKYIKEKGYQRVAIVDDSCSIRPDCPNLFDIVPFGSLGGVRSGIKRAKESFDFIAQHRNQVMLPKFDAKDYLAGGILIYSADIEPVIAPSEI
jgi:hypothetical protein